MGADDQQGKVGGLVFYFSLCALLLLASATLWGLLQVIWNSDLFSIVGVVCGGVLGAIIAAFLIIGRLSVFLHELKHKILANLCGNKAKAMEVNSREGSFTYAYTRETAHYNAFISVAPYWLPLFQFICCAVALAVLPAPSFGFAALVGAGIGIDLVLNIRDIGPHQTDFTQLLGGYRIGVLFSALANVVFVSIALAIGLGQIGGLTSLFWSLWGIIEFVVQAIRGGAS